MVGARGFEPPASASRTKKNILIIKHLRSKRALKNTIENHNTVAFFVAKKISYKIQYYIN